MSWLPSLTITVDPDELAQLSTRATGIAERVAAAEYDGGSPSAEAVGHAAIAEAILALRLASRARIATIGSTVGEAGVFLQEQAESWAALDELLAGG